MLDWNVLDCLTAFELYTLINTLGDNSALALSVNVLSTNVFFPILIKFIIYQICCYLCKYLKSSADNSLFILIDKYRHGISLDHSLSPFKLKYIYCYISVYCVYS